MSCGKALVNPFFAIAILYIICYIFRGQHEVAAVYLKHNNTVFIDTSIPQSMFHIREKLWSTKHICSPGQTYIVSNNNPEGIDLKNLLRFKNEPEVIGNLAPCNVCICSIDGLRQTCLNRTGNGMNECIMLALAAKKHLHRPHNQWASLFNRIRKEDVICCNHDATHQKSIHDKIKLRVKKELDPNAVKVEDLLKMEPEIKKHKRFSGANDYMDFIVNNDK